MLVSQGKAIVNNDMHPYAEEFMTEQETAKKDKLGIWADDCIPTPTLSQNQKIQITPSPSPKPINSPTPSPTKTATPTPTAQIKGESTRIDPTVTPTITLKEYITSSPSAVISKPLNADLVLQLINLHRKTKSLPAFEKNDELCKLAESRAPEIDNEIFGNGTIHAGFRAWNIPYWITENMAGYGSEAANVNWWLGSTIHRNAIEGNYKYSCGACTERSCVQLFTSYIPK